MSIHGTNLQDQAASLSEGLSPGMHVKLQGGAVKVVQGESDAATAKIAGKIESLVEASSPQDLKKLIGTINQRANTLDSKVQDKSWKRIVLRLTGSLARIRKRVVKLRGLAGKVEGVYNLKIQQEGIEVSKMLITETIQEATDKISTQIDAFNQEKGFLAILDYTAKQVLSSSLPNKELAQRVSERIKQNFKPEDVDIHIRQEIDQLIKHQTTSMKDH